MAALKHAACHDPHEQRPNPAEARGHPVRELHDRLDRGLDRKGDSIAQGPVVATAVTRKAGPHVRAPKHDRYGVDEKRRRRDSEPIGEPHRGTMESKLTLVNDREAQLVLLASALIVDH